MTSLAVQVAQLLLPNIISNKTFVLNLWNKTIQKIHDVNQEFNKLNEVANFNRKQYCTNIILFDIVAKNIITVEQIFLNQLVSN